MRATTSTSTRAKYHSGWARRFDPPFLFLASIMMIVAPGSVGSSLLLLKRWDDLGSWMHISGCSSRAAAAAPIVPRSLCAEYCAGDLPGRSTTGIDGLFKLFSTRSVTMHACTCSDRSAIATGRTYENSVTRHRKICRRRACYVKTLATDRVLSDANERARSLAVHP
jgi:hypothetical protein